MHKIPMEDNFKPLVEHQCRLNPIMKDVVRAEVLKLLDARIIYPISDSSWVSPVQVVPKKGGITVVKNGNNELIPTRTVTGWRFCMILWGVWSDRNAVFHSKFPRVNADLVSWSLSLLREFQGTKKVFGSPYQPPRQPCSASWSPPPASSLKLNTDAAVKSGFSVMGSGAVVRDSQGKVVAASAKPLLGFFPTELGELLALREGLLVAKELSLIIEWVELDAANAVARISNSCPSSFMDPIVSDIKALFRVVGVSNCHAIPRSRNGMAHSLASLAFSSKEDFCWFNPEPSFLVGLL
ncbi:hypothetical protein ACOSQ2_013759 [Xanthoceras sorbifolium]